MRLSLRLLGTLLAALPWLALPPAWGPEATWEFRNLAASAALAACLGVMLHEARQGEAKIKGTDLKAWLREPFHAGAMLALAGMLLSALCSPVPGLGLFSITQNVLFILFSVSLSAWRVSAAETRWLLLCLLATMGCEALLALGQFFAPEMVRAVAPVFASPEAGRAAIIGTLENPEYLAGWLAAGVAGSVVIGWRGARRATRGADVLTRLAVAVGALAFSVIFLGGGRGALLAVLGALALAGLTHWRAWRADAATNGNATPRSKPPSWRIPVAAAAALLALLGAVWLFQKPEVRRGGLPARLAEMTNLHSASMRHRLGLLAVTSNIILDHPLLGVGPGRYGWAFSATQARLASEEQGIGYWALGDVMAGTFTSEAHCDPLQWWAEYGLLGVVGLTLMIGRALTGSASALKKCGMRNAECGKSGEKATGGLMEKESEDGRQKVFGMNYVLGMALWAALAALAIDMWLAFPLQRPVRGLTFWVLLGLVAGRMDCTNNRNSKKIE